MTDRLAEAEPLMRRMVAILEAVERSTGYRLQNQQAALDNFAAFEADIAAQAGPPPIRRGFWRRLFGRE